MKDLCSTESDKMVLSGQVWDVSSAVLKIQEFFRGRRDVNLERSLLRKQFLQASGDHCQKLNVNCFRVDSKFVPQLLFFFSAKNYNDVAILIKMCQLLLKYVRKDGKLQDLFSLTEAMNKPLVDLRMKKFTVTCIKAIYHYRDSLKDQFLEQSDILLDTVATLLNPALPWSRKVSDELLQKNIFILLRGIILSYMNNMEETVIRGSMPLLNDVLTLVTFHTSRHPCSSSDADPKLCFSLQILSLPFLWQRLSNYKKDFLKIGLAEDCIHQLALYLPGHVSILPNDLPHYFPVNACLLGNLLEVGVDVVLLKSCSRCTAMDFVLVLSILLEAIPKLNSTVSEGAFDEKMSKVEQQIMRAMRTNFVHDLVNAVFWGISDAFLSYKTAPSDEMVEAIGFISAFLFAASNALSNERFLTELAYGTDLILLLWNFVKYCHESQIQPTFFNLTACIPGDSIQCWLLTLAVLCPIYKCRIINMDILEAYDPEHPLSLRNMKLLVVILKQVLWQLLWVIPANMPLQKLENPIFVYTKLSLDSLISRTCAVVSELLDQLQDWNNRESFTLASDFQVVEAKNDVFINQALTKNSRASGLLNQAPFLVPFESRLEIFTKQLAASKAQQNAETQIYIRRKKIFRDSKHRLKDLSKELLKGQIRVSYIDTFGNVEAGIDGGGIFKDFMENIIHIIFGVKSKIFKETTGHLLYPKSITLNFEEQLPELFYFAGILLGKAIYEGILVDIRFATFFLRKLKKKINGLNDLASLDPEFYRQLISIKAYQDVKELELYFVIMMDNSGTMIEEELVINGKNMLVKQENVASYIHLVAKHRLNNQIECQSSHFLRGFQQCFDKEWIEMFSEPEIQILISGKLENLNIDDLSLNTTYSGDYHRDHPVICMFWEVVRTLSVKYQRKLLKFVTGCSRGPLLGFKFLDPKLCIRRDAASLNTAEEDIAQLPTAATCINMLRLPPYKSIEQMRKKIMYAISVDVGFGLE